MHPRCPKKGVSDFKYSFTLTDRRHLTHHAVGRFSCDFPRGRSKPRKKRKKKRRLEPSLGQAMGGKVINQSSTNCCVNLASSCTCRHMVDRYWRIYFKNFPSYHLLPSCRFKLQILLVFYLSKFRLFKALFLFHAVTCVISCIHTSPHTTEKYSSDILGIAQQQTSG